MSIINEIKPLQNEMINWRRKIHKNPELGFEEKFTSDFIAEKLTEFGIDIHRGLAKTGVVGKIVNGKGPSIGLRADMDALPVEEKNTFEYRSKFPGKMHACGHDGHVTMLLGAAKYLANKKNFNGTVNLIFQPAEEGLGGADMMIKDGLFKKFPMESVYGLHNWPGMPAGHFGIGKGAVMAAADFFDLEIIGVGGHAAMPNNCIDPIVLTAQVISALQSISSRETNPLDSVVISITQVHSGDAYNIIPDSVKMNGTVRSFNKDIRKKLPESMLRIINGICEAFGAKCKLKYINGYPATINSDKETEISRNVAKDIVGKEKIFDNPTPSMVTEDFSYMLQKLPGCYIWLGTGNSKGITPCLHSSNFDFNDNVLKIGAAYWIKLVEKELSI